MRLYIRLTLNSIPIPFCYQHLLTGVIHKWLGRGNEFHGIGNLFSFSWLQNTELTESGIALTNKSYFFFSSNSEQVIKKLLNGILREPELFNGIKVRDVQITDTPSFQNVERFILTSPILIRKKQGDNIKHITYKDPEFDELLTINAKSKLRRANKVDEGLFIEWDKAYPNPKTKLVTYKGVGNKATLAPIIVKGTPEQIAFLWTVGLGESTGIGFGSIK